MTTLNKQKPDTRQNLIQAAAWLIHRHGYHGTGLSDILARSNAPKGVLYYHFPGGKPELAVAALALTTEIFNQQLLMAAKRTRTATGFIKAMADLTKEDLLVSDYRAGCPLTTTALETAPEEPALTTACRDGFEVWISTVANIFETHGLPKVKARRLAEQSMAGFEGALAIARTRKDVSIIDLTADGLIQILTAQRQ
ncbi:MAG: TetR/AcrR family transcriptional regulator [Aquisalinus sp.]|nr:TetR/AcrR family transcriptional regulator [Aquisalinus sp.]